MVELASELPKMVEEFHPTKRAILAAAVDELDLVGQRNFRIARVIAETGSSYSSLYHHVDSRENLVREAQAIRFVRATNLAATTFEQLLHGTESTEDFFDALVTLIDLILLGSHFRRERGRRIEVLGFAMTDGDLEQRIGEQQRVAFAPVAILMREAQARGVINHELQIETYLLWLSGIQLGHILAEIDPTVGAYSAGWREVAIRAYLQPLLPKGLRLQWPNHWGLDTQRISRLESTARSLGCGSLSLPNRTISHIATAVDPPKAQEAVTPEPSMHATKRALIDRTKFLLLSFGEESLRIADILDGLNISVTSIYHFFGGREELVDAASCELFIDGSGRLFEASEMALAHVASVEEFVALIEQMLRINSSDNLLVRRHRWRLQVLGAAISRPQLLVALGAEQAALLSQFAQIGHRAIERGLFREDLDCAAAILWLQGTQLGRALIEIDAEHYDLTEWIRLTSQGVLAAFCRPMG